MSPAQEQEIDRLMQVISQIYKLAVRGKYYAMSSALHEICLLAGRVSKEAITKPD